MQWITRVKYHQATILYQKCLLWELGIYKKWQWVARLEREFRPEYYSKALGFFSITDGKLLKFLIRRMTYLNKKLPRNLAGASERKEIRAREIS